jgi:hypothetical protein
MKKECGGFGAYGGTGGLKRGHSFRKLQYLQATRTTWNGVFLPVSLSIFGAVMFIRLPWIVGECGFLFTLLGVLLSFGVSGLTTISVCAISTNGFVGDGGPYMMVTRSLGAQFGVTVGLMFVLANIIAAAMYLVGGSQAVIAAVGVPFLTNALNEYPFVTTLICSSSTLTILMAIALLHLDTGFRMVCLLLTLISYFDALVNIWIGRNINWAHVGISTERWVANLYPDFSEGVNFQYALAILFPGVTGLIGGVLLSGEMKNSAKAIPRGLGASWLVSVLSYIALAAFLAASFDRSALKQNFSVLSMAADPIAFRPGEFCCGFAAAVGGLAGSARVLRGIANDKLLPFRPLKAFEGTKLLKPTIFCWAMVQLLLIAGGVQGFYNVMSHGATVVFTATFFALNASTFLPSISGVPSFRPTFPFYNNFTVFLGMAGSLFVMFFTNPLPSLVILLLLLILLILIDSQIDAEKVTWGDPSQPILFYVVRKWLLKLNERKEHSRHWRPSLLHVVTDPECSLNLIHFANNLKKGGLYQLLTVLDGDFQATLKACHSWKAWFLDFVEASGVKGFPVVAFGESLRATIQLMLRTSGLGGMRPNTVLLSLDEFHDNGEKPHSTKALRRRSLATNGSESAGEDNDGSKSGKSSSRSASTATPAEHNLALKEDFGSTVSDSISDTGSAPVRHEGTFALEEDPSGAHLLESPSENSMTPQHQHLNVNDDDDNFFGRTEQSMAFSPLTHDADEKKRLLDTWNQSYDEESPCKPQANNGRRGARAVVIAEPEKTKKENGTAKTKVLSDLNSPDEAPLDHPQRNMYRKTQYHLKGLLKASQKASCEAEAMLLKKLRHRRLQDAEECGVELHPFSTQSEFVGIVEDVNRLGMSAVLSRNFDKLDKQKIKDAMSKGKGDTPGNGKPMWVDVWTPDEENPVPILLAYCLCLTSVWKTHTRIRLIEIVEEEADVEEARKQLDRLFTTHRIHAEALIVVLEREAAALGFPNAEALADELDSGSAERAKLLNKLYRRHSTAESTALCILHAESPQDFGGTANRWFSDIDDRLKDLPPSLCVVGSALHCHPDEW